MAVNNPILPGFNPDPSICRVGDDYYIATSTFEWYPGVQIHHSKDLVNWTLVSRPLNRADLLDMTGVPDSCGVWAPCLSYSDGRFYLVYTNVKRFDGNFKDTHNYLTTCENIDGEWSPRVYLNSSGFDPSLFHDTDGKKYLLNMVWDHRPDRSFFGGVLLQEYSEKEQALVGRVHNIFSGSSLGFTEGPHLYRLNGYYYLLTAEGGTGYDHAMTMARSKNLLGPYEVDPEGAFVSARHDTKHPIQRAGHGDIVQDEDGQWYAVHLCSRPLSLHGGREKRSPMGRETALQKIRWGEDGWCRLEDGVTEPALTLTLPSACVNQNAGRRYQFDGPDLHQDFQWLRIPEPHRIFSLGDAPGVLRMYGAESIGSCFTSALVARRQTDFRFRAACALRFNPSSFQQMAGLVCYYNAHKFHYLYLGWDDAVGRYLGVMSCEGKQSLEVRFPLWDKKIPVTTDTVHLRAEVNYDLLLFSWSETGETWTSLPIELDFSLLSDEAGKGEGANFTGAFIGMACQDLTGQRQNADFEYFEYRPEGNA